MILLFSTPVLFFLVVVSLQTVRKKYMIDFACFIMEYDFITESTVSLSHASIGVRCVSSTLLQLTLYRLGSWKHHSLLCHPLIAFTWSRTKEVGMLTKFSWSLLTLFLWYQVLQIRLFGVQVQAPLVFELLALDFSRMPGIFVETIWKT